MNLNGTADVRATFTAEGRKNRAVVKLEEIEQISSLHRKENEDNGMFLKNPLVFTFLHRRPFPIDAIGIGVLASKSIEEWLKIKGF